MERTFDNAERKQPWRTGWPTSSFALHLAFWRGRIIWLMAITVVAFAVYRLAFAPISAISHRVAIGPIVAEVMGTGTLNPHVKAGASPKAFEGRLSRVLVDQNNLVPRRFQWNAGTSGRPWKARVWALRPGNTGF